MLHYLYSSVTINESKETFRIVFRGFSAIKTLLDDHLFLTFQQH